MSGKKSNTYEQKLRDLWASKISVILKSSVALISTTILDWDDDIEDKLGVGC